MYLFMIGVFLVDCINVAPYGKGLGLLILNRLGFWVIVLVNFGLCLAGKKN